MVPRRAAAAPLPVQQAAAIERAELEHPVSTPPGVDRRAAVHDAAVHGVRIAGAIERGRATPPSSPAQQQGGAAASAASSQGVPLPLARRGASDELIGPTEDVDPLGPIHGIGDGPDDERRDDDEEQDESDESATDDGETSDPEREHEHEHEHASETRP